MGVNVTEERFRGMLFQIVIKQKSTASDNASSFRGMLFQIVIKRNQK